MDLVVVSVCLCGRTDVNLELIPGNLKQAIASARHPEGVRLDPCLSRATSALLEPTWGSPKQTANSMAYPSKEQTDGRILVAGAVMEYDVSEVRLENAETDAGNEEVIELSTDLLGQVGGGTGNVTI
jgi:hypothetical protein